jgi:LemA protein
MASGLIVLIVIVVAAGIVGLWLMGAYNGLVGLRNQVQNAWAQIDVQLKRRWDLIPNLVETVKGYAKHEAGTFEAVTQARAAAQSAAGAGVAARAQAEGELSSVLTRLLAVAEAYPELKANQNFLALQEELSSTENKISFSRQFYNDTVMQFNNKTQMFPSNIVAGVFNFKAAEPFKIEEAAAREAPKVSF